MAEIKETKAIIEDDLKRKTSRIGTIQIIAIINDTVLKKKAQKKDGAKSQ